MKLTLVAVGRLPAWAQSACNDYLQRLPRAWPVRLIEIKTEPRSSGKPVAALLSAEAQRIEAALSPQCRRIVLDERGRDLTTVDLAQRLRHWALAGTEVALLIGGPDGLAARLKEKAVESWRLSSLTLPHALARVLLCEALYRAASLNEGHPYHRGE